MWNGGIVVLEGRQRQLKMHSINTKAIIKITRVTANKSIKEVKLNHGKARLCQKKAEKGNKVQMEQNKK